MPDSYPGSTQRATPNYGYPPGSSGRGGEQIVAIVDHIAQGTKAGLDATFGNSNSQVSAHFGVMRDGTVHQYVREEDASWGAGLLEKPDETLPWLPPAGPARGQKVNQRAISIEHEGYSGEPLTPEQFQATVDLHRYLVQKWGIQVGMLHIVGHNSLNSVNRQGCPGPAFPWDDLLSALLGAPVRGLGEGAVRNKQRVQQALDVVWGWSERIAQLSAVQAAKELKDAVAAVKEEAGLETTSPPGQTVSVDKPRVQRALNAVWGWSERIEQLSAAQAAKELKDAVVAIKEEVGL